MDLELHEGPKDQLQPGTFSTVPFHICPHTPAFPETGIQQNRITCFDADEKHSLKQNGTDFDFDIFAAIFYLISRYEYLPHELDMYGRYAIRSVRSGHHGKE